MPKFAEKTWRFRLTGPWNLTWRCPCAYTPKSAGSALVIGKIVLTMLVAAAKINQSSIVPAFDQTRVPRIIQVPSGAANS